MPDPHELRVRRATAGDLPRILELLSRDALREQPEDLGPPLPPAYAEAFAAIDADPSQLLCVAELDGEVVGTFQLSFIRYLMYRGGLVAQLESVRVDERLRSRGLGSRMMRWAIDEARRRGCARVQLTSNLRREAAHRFYERLGFSRSHLGFKLFLG